MLDTTPNWARTYQLLDELEDQLSWHSVSENEDGTILFTGHVKATNSTQEWLIADGEAKPVED